MSLSFCAIDFETANSYRGSPCAVGLIKVVDGQIVDSRR
jgi:DNA polymerase-3 subunit epsilon